MDRVNPPLRPSITLVRHGESTWNELSLIQGQDNTAQLTARGRDQARQAVRVLVGEGFDYLVASDLDRARETAEIIGSALGLEPATDGLLRERCFGEYEGRSISDITTELTGIDHHVLVNPDARPPGGESFRDVVTRAGFFLKRIRDEASGQRVLVVTHGGTIRALRASARDESLVGISWYRVDNCSVWQLASNDAD